MPKNLHYIVRPAVTAKNGSKKTKYDQPFLPVSVAPMCHYTMTDSRKQCF